MALSRISPDSISDDELRPAIAALKNAISDLFTREHRFESLERDREFHLELAGCIREDRKGLEAVLALLVHEQQERLIDAHDKEDDETAAH